MLIAAPARNGLISPQPATVAAPRGHRGEPSAKRIKLTVLIAAPARNGLISPQPAAVTLAHGDGHELADGRIGLTVLVGAPAEDCPVDSQRAGMPPARGDDSSALEVGCEQVVQNPLIYRDGRRIVPPALAARRAVGTGNLGGAGNLGGRGLGVDHAPVALVVREAL